MSTLRADRKLPAFTVLELLIGMIVSAIVLATMFSAYHIISQQALNYSKRSAAYMMRSQLHSLLTRDVLCSDSVSFSAEEKLQCMDDGRTVLYQIQDTFVVREWNDQRDTFFTRGLHTEEYFIRHERDQHQP